MLLSFNAFSKLLMIKSLKLTLSPLTLKLSVPKQVVLAIYNDLIFFCFIACDIKYFIVLLNNRSSLLLITIWFFLYLRANTIQFLIF